MDRVLDIRHFEIHIPHLRGTEKYTMLIKISTMKKEPEYWILETSKTSSKI